ncbi:tape measure protein [Megasphaera massiliensis]|uniref:tape measure protein n=1 Tax=Megasphaera massiliensis TaxID=1232428 RepID=UPI0009DC0BA7|nr:tape measure protein [Megasphaera massiliensis]
MATISSIIVRIGANSSQLRSELRRTNAELKSSFGESLALSRGLAAGIAAVGASFLALSAKMVQAAGGFQQVETAMTNMLGSAAEAQNLLGKLQDFAAKTPFEFDDVTRATQKFLAFGFTADQVIPTLRAVGDAAAGVGLGKEGIDRITIALGQMAAKARVQSDEMLQLTEAGIPAWQMLADKIGTSVPQAMDMVKDGAIDAQTGLQALVGGMQERFGGMMDAQSKQVMGSWSNMMDGISQSAIALGLQLSDALNLPDLFSTIGDSLQEFAALVKDEGIPAALSKMIPPEVQIAAAGLATVLTVSTIPAIMEFSLQARLAAVPLLGSFGKGLSAIKAGLLAIPPGVAAATSSLTLFKAAASSAGTSMAGLGTSLKAGLSSLPQLITGFGRFLIALGPVGIAIGAVGIAIAAFLSSGHKMEGLLNVVPGTMDAVKMAGESLKRLWGELGQAIANLVSAAAPLITVLATVFTAAIYAIIAVINVVVTVLSWWLTMVSTIITAVIATFNMLYDKVATALGKVGDALSNMADSILPAWASDGLKTIKGFVQTAMGWLNKLINKIFQTNNALSNAGNKMTPEERARRQANQDTYQNAQTTADDDTDHGTPDYSQFKSAGDADGADGGKAIGKGGSASSKTNNYDPREGAIYNAQALTGLSYGTGEGQVVCTTYIENAWAQAGVSNAWDLGPNANYWAQNAGGAFHAAGSGYVPKAGDVAITNDGEGDPQGHVIMIDENGTGYYAAGGSKGVSAHYNTDHRDAFDVYGYISMAEYAGFQDSGRSMSQRPQFNWDRSEYTQAIRAAATSYNLDPALLLAVAMRESGGDTIGGLTMAGGNGGGMMQILSPDQDISDGNGGRVRIGDLYQNYQTDVLSNAMAGAAMLKDKIDANGGDTWAGVADYYGGADKADYAAKVKANYGKVQAEGASSGGNFVQQQAQYQKRMAEQAIQTHKQIDDSYAQSTATQAELVDRKYDKEREKLEETKAFNANYAKDKAKLDEMYAQEHLKAVEEDAMKEQQLRAKAQEIAGNIKTNAPAVTDTASTKALSKMEADYDKAIESIRTRWQQYAVDYTNMTESQKALFLKALDDEGVAYELAADGRLSFARQMYAEELAQYKAYLDEKTAYYQQAKDIEADIDEAKNLMSLEKLQEVLTDANAIRLSDYEAQKAMLDTYQETYLAAHASTAQMVASLYSTAFDGLSSAITDTIMGTKSLGDAFQALGKSLIQVVVQFYAKQLAGMLVNSAMAKAQSSAAVAQTAAEGAAMSAALGPAAFFKLVLSPASAGVAMGLLSTGTSAALGTSMAGALAGGTWSGKQAALQRAPWNNLPKLATGGITKGSTVAMIGEGRHDEAVLPLSRDKFEQLGLIDKDPKAVNNVSLNVNALDSASFVDFLRNGGLDTIRQAIFENDRNFGTEAGVF